MGLGHSCLHGICGGRDRRQANALLVLLDDDHTTCTSTAPPRECMDPVMRLNAESMIHAVSFLCPSDVGTARRHCWRGSPLWRRIQFHRRMAAVSTVWRGFLDATMAHWTSSWTVEFWNVPEMERVVLWLCRHRPSLRCIACGSQLRDGQDPRWPTLAAALASQTLRDCDTTLLLSAELRLYLPDPTSSAQQQLQEDLARECPRLESLRLTLAIRSQDRGPPTPKDILNPLLFSSSTLRQLSITVSLALSAHGGLDPHFFSTVIRDLTALCHLTLASRGPMLSSSRSDHPGLLIASSTLQILKVNKLYLTRSCPLFLDCPRLREFHCAGARHGSIALAGEAAADPEILVLSQTVGRADRVPEQCRALLRWGGQPILRLPFADLLPGSDKVRPL